MRVPVGFGIDQPVGVRRTLPRNVVLPRPDEPVVAGFSGGATTGERFPAGGYGEAREPAVVPGSPPHPALQALGRFAHWIDTPGREYLREPLSTAATYASLSEARGTDKDWFDIEWNPVEAFRDAKEQWGNRERWQESHDIAQNRSVGQSMALMFLSSDEPGKRVTDEEFMYPTMYGLDRPPMWDVYQRDLGKFDADEDGDFVSFYGDTREAVQERFDEYLDEYEAKGYPRGWTLSRGTQRRDTDQDWYTFGQRHSGDDPSAPFKTLSGLFDLAFRVNPIDPINFGFRALVGLAQKGTAAAGRAGIQAEVQAGRLLDPDRFISLEAQQANVPKFVAEFRAARPNPDVYQQYADRVVDGWVTPVERGNNTILTRDIFGIRTPRAGEMPAVSSPRATSSQNFQMGPWWHNVSPEQGGSGNAAAAVRHYLRQAGIDTTVLTEAHFERIAGLVQRDLQGIFVKAVDDIGVGSTMPVLRTQIQDAPLGPSVGTAPIDVGGRNYLPWAQIRKSNVMEAVVDPRKDILASMDLRNLKPIGEYEAIMNPEVLAAKTVRTSPTMAEAVYGPNLNTIPRVGQAANQPIDDYLRWLQTNEEMAASFGKPSGIMRTGVPSLLSNPEAALLEKALLDLRSRRDYTRSQP